MSKSLEALEKMMTTIVSIYSMEFFSHPENPKMNEEEHLREIYNVEVIEKELKALKIIKENLVVSYDESENDKPCLTLGIKDYKGVLLIFYSTFDKEKIDLLKEVLL